MGDIVRIHLSCIPPTANHQRKRIVRIKLRDGREFTKLADKPELRAATAMLDSLLLSHQIPQPVAAPVALVIEFTWPWLSTHGKRVRAQGRIPHTGRPDCDNAAKTLTDRLADLRFIEDDKHIADLRVRKWWGNTPGIEIAIAPFIVQPTVALHSQPTADLFSFAPLE